MEKRSVRSAIICRGFFLLDTQHTANKKALERPHNYTQFMENGGDGRKAS